MKKLIAMMLSVFMVFTLAACGNTQNESDRTTSGSMTESQETKTPQEPESSTQPEEEASNKNTEGNAGSTGGKTLVVHFSMPETAEPDNMTEEEDNSVVVIDGEVLGSTQYVAYVIQENTGADIFRIEPETPYPTDHDTLVDLAAFRWEVSILGVPSGMRWIISAILCP